MYLVLLHVRVIDTDRVVDCPIKKTQNDTTRYKKTQNILAPNINFYLPEKCSKVALPRVLTLKLYYPQRDDFDSSTYNTNLL